MLFFFREQHVAVGKCGYRVVDRAGADDNQQSILCIAAIDDGLDLLAAFEDCALRLRSLLDFVLQQVGGCEGIVATNWSREG